MAVCRSDSGSSLVQTSMQQTIRFRDPNSRLTPDHVGHSLKPKPQSSMESGPPPPATQGAGSRGLFAPSQPSPLSYSVASVRPPLVSSLTQPATKKSIFSPALVEAKKKKLSLETARKKAVEQIASPLGTTKGKQGGKDRTTHVIKAPLSSTMVQLPVFAKMDQKNRDQALSAPITSYQFSPGKIISTPPVEPLERLPMSGHPTYAFSPPLTRSAARRKMAEHRETEMEGEADIGTGMEELRREPLRGKSQVVKETTAAAKPEKLQKPPESSRRQTRSTSVSSSHSESDDPQTVTGTKPRTSRKTTRCVLSILVSIS